MFYDSATVLKNAPPAASDLVKLERQVCEALAERAPSGLPVIGFGEISVALGWPTGTPTHVCKRMPPANEAEFANYKALVDRYLAELNAAGVQTLRTDVVAVDSGEQAVAYLIQPFVAAETIGHSVLAAAEPDSEHPLLAAIGEALHVASPTLSLDAQLTNWSWSEGQPWLVDVGTPFMWDDAGELLIDMAPFLGMFPRPLRGFVRRDLSTLLTRWQTPRGVAVDLVANLYREGMNGWVPAAVEAMNRTVGPAEPITAEEADGLYQEDLKTFPRLKRLQQIERFWQSKIRGQPYQFFIQSTLDGGGDLSI